MNKYQRFFEFFLIFCCICLSCVEFESTAYASNHKPSLNLTSEEKIWLDEHRGNVRLVPSPDREPMEFYTEDGEYRGIVADYIRLIEQRLNFEFKVIRTQSWSENLTMARNKEIDVISAAQATPDRKKYMIWSSPYLTLKTTIIVKKDTQKNSILEKMDGMRTGVPRGYAVGIWLRENYPHLNYKDVEHTKEGLYKVSFGELDAMIAEVPNALYVIENEKITNLRLAGDTGFELQMGIGVRNDWPVFAQIIEKVMADISKEEHQAIYNKWIHLQTAHFYETRTFWHSIIGVLVFVLTAVGTVMVWNRTLQKQVQQRTEAVRFNEKNLRDIVENSPNGITIIQNSQVVYRNPQQLRLAGEIKLGKKIRYDHIHYEDQEAARNFYESILSGNPEQSELSFRFYNSPANRSKGNLKWVTCLVTPINYKDSKAFLLTTIDRTRARELEHLLTVQDKMASLGRVAAGIGHEIRNPLSGINIYLRAIEKGVKNPSKAHKIAPAIDAIRTASSKMEAVVKRVIDFAKPIEPKFAQTDINGPVQEAVQLANMSMAKKKIRLEADLDPDLPLCFAEHNLIEEVVLNLIHNAVDALNSQDNEKRIWVTTAMADSKITISVEDTGPGVSVDLADKVFEPFYTTKEYSTGIGLSLCQRIITDHNGTIRVEPGKNGGARFIAALPMAAQTSSGLHRKEGIQS